MKLLLFITIILILSTGEVIPCESHAYFSASQEYNLRSGNYLGEAPTTFELGYRYRVGESIYFGPIISHKSNIRRGWPVNNSRENPETWNDTVGIKFEKRWE